MPPHLLNTSTCWAAITLKPMGKPAPLNAGTGPWTVIFDFPRLCTHDAVYSLTMARGNPHNLLMSQRPKLNRYSTVAQMYNEPISTNIAYSTISCSLSYVQSSFKPLSFWSIEFNPRKHQWCSEYVSEAMRVSPCPKAMHGSMGSQNLVCHVGYGQNVRLSSAVALPQFHPRVQGGRGVLQPKGIGDTDPARPLVERVL